MQPKRFTGTSVRAVMAEVRATFGRDALILEQQQSGSVVEMLATIMPEAEPADVITPISRMANRRKQRATARNTAAVATDQPATAELYLLRLRAMGFSEAVLAQLPVTLKNWRAVMQALLQTIPIASHLPDSGVLTVTGPSGAGVTSSLIKYAVHLIRSGKNPKRIRFAHCGPERLGGSEALMLAGQLLGVSVDRHSLDTALQKLAEAHPETLLLADLSSAMDGGTPPPALDDPLIPAQELLVLPAHWRAEVLQRWLDAQDNRQEVGYQTQCIVSHVDYCRQWGDWLSLVIERDLPLAQLGHGPRLPDDACVPTGPWLERHLLDQIDRSRPATKVNAGETAVDH